MDRRRGVESTACAPAHVADRRDAVVIQPRRPVDAEARSNLAHLAADGSVLPWAPQPNNRVWALALQGDTLFVGGDFDSIGGAARGRLAALAGASSAPLPWQCDADGRVSALMASGGTLYAGGWFSTLAGQPRSYVGAMTTDTGALTPWQVSLDDRVRAIALADTTLYIGGYFSFVNGELHRALTAVGTQSGAVHPWDAQLVRMPISTIDGGPHINALLLDGDSLLVAGSFSSLGGQPRSGLAKLDLATALATSWQVSADYPRALGAEFWALERSGDTLFVAGQFDSLAGAPGSNAAALSLTSAERLSWNPRSNDYIFAVALQRDEVYLGGWFTSIGPDWVERRGLAAIDARTGRVTDWNPQPDDYVKSMLAWGGKIFVGGYFTAVGGQPRNFIAALDPITGQATSWNPGANWAPWVLQPLGSALLVGGIFTAIAGRSQRNLAAIDTATAQLTSWNPGAFGDVYAVAVTDTAVYIGGDFTTFGGQPRASLAAVDPKSGALLPWNPGCDGSVSALALHGGTIYVGGYFQQLGGSSREFLGAVDRDGSATSWAPNTFGPDAPRVEALAASDSFIFAGGFFSGAAGVSSEYFAALNPITGAVDCAFPTPNGPVWTLATQGNVVYVGGGFGQVGRWPQESFAAIDFTGPSPPAETSDFAFFGPMPNPAHEGALIRYILPARSPVSIGVYDLQGRIVARVLRGEMQPAGQHSAALAISGWRPGCYLVRFEAGRLRTTRKLVIVK